MQQLGKTNIDVRKKTVYLSGGIMNFSTEDTHDWREYCKKNLKHDTIDPTRISYKGREPREIVELDKNDIDNSTHVLVNFIRPSVGTSMEVLYAWEKGKPVFIINETGQELSPWLLYHSNAIFPSLKAAVDHLND